MTGWREKDAAVYVLQDPLIWRRVEQYVPEGAGGIEFDALLEGPYRTFSHGEQLLVLAALDLWNGRAHDVMPMFGLRTLVNTLVSPHLERVIDGTLILYGLAPILTEKLGLIGHDRAVAGIVAVLIHRQAEQNFDYTELRETRRGSEFEVKRGQHVFRVSVELDRIENGGGE